ncbi:MAG TPA: hypothetical protein VIU46_12270 [Gallionellaceae bacterium]
MGMTYWIQTLENDSITSESDDHSMMHSLSDDLDQACRNLGVPELSSFADFTDLELNMTDEDGTDEEWDEEDFDDEAHLDKMKDKMEWFDPAAGLQCLEALRQHVEEGWNVELDDDRREWLLEELDDCIDTLKALPKEGARFNLAVIM